VKHAQRAGRASESLRPDLADEEAIAACARAVATPLLASGDGIRAILVRLSRLQAPDNQPALFPAAPQLRHA
jgi:hypothetical protein